ncbi:Ion channel [Chitinophaga sp. CF118]|uniref:ion channel n=1 Tax=Chitinophaga sp. CF118 TaxID=1884367 RepID=UPI0008E77077|nr:ion channel [Chitinophaga sp. CF118]SFE49914.1 Ion channel [Chitinophaga sp. CF118]
MQIIMTMQETKLIQKILCHARKKRYELLLISFMVFIFGNTFSEHVHVVAIFNIYQNMIAGFIVFYYNKRLRIFILVVITCTVFLDLCQSELGITDIKSWLGILYLLFFFIVATDVFKEVLYAKRVSRSLLSAALCGFVLLCLIGTFVFYQIQIKEPNAFSNTGTGYAVMNNLNYFSFTTLLTIGYGDILPLSLLARRAVMLIGLAGHFYTVFVTSIIIGKYLSVNNKKLSLSYQHED